MKTEMEFKLLKTIETGFTTAVVPKQTLPILSPYPATDFVNPGLGQISRLYSFCVPTYTNKNLHELKKQSLLETHENLEGSGASALPNLSNEENPETNEQKLIASQISMDPNKLNELNRKRMGSGIHEAFLYPKMIKTDKLILKPPSKQEPKEHRVKIPNLANKKSIKHKFQFL